MNGYTPDPDTLNPIPPGWEEISFFDAQVGANYYLYNKTKDAYDLIKFNKSTITGTPSVIKGWWEFECPPSINKYFIELGENASGDYRLFRLSVEPTKSKERILAEIEALSIEAKGYETENLQIIHDRQHNCYPAKTFFDIADQIRKLAEEL